MRRPVARFFQTICVVCLAAATPGLASADTIYLKNGEKIAASNVVEKDGRVSYETSAGSFSLPASIVEKVVRETKSTDAPAARGGNSASRLTIAPPSLGSDASDNISRDAVRDHAVNGELLARLESDADANPTPSAIAQVVAAERAAAQFEISVGDLPGADSHYRTALRYAPEHLALLLDFAYLHLERSEYSEALDLLEHARAVAPDSPEVAKLTGWAYYGLNRLPDAVKEWKRSLDLRPDPEVQHVLEKAERDVDEEANYHEGESVHFQLHNGDATPELARDILRTLETEYDEISTTLDYTPPAAISVTLYTNQAFVDITRAPSWVGALNDGRIRVPVEGLSTVTDELARILKHELTHSFLTQKTANRCPVWLQEGVAQYMEGKRTGTLAGSLIASYDQHMEISLASYESSWMNLSPDVAGAAYSWSLAVVETIVNEDGMSDIERILDRIAAQTAPEDAVHAVLRDSYADLMQATVAYLRKTYVN